MSRERPQPQARLVMMIGIEISAWSALPIEEVLLWLVVTFTAVVIFEAFSWHAAQRSVGLLAEPPHAVPEQPSKATYQWAPVHFRPTIARRSAIPTSGGHGWHGGLVTAPAKQRMGCCYS